MTLQEFEQAGLAAARHLSGGIADSTVDFMREFDRLAGHFPEQRDLIAGTCNRLILHALVSGFVVPLTMTDTWRNATPADREAVKLRMSALVTKKLHDAFLEAEAAAERASH